MGSIFAKRWIIKRGNCYSKAFLWKGHCSVHQMFQPEHIQDFRSKYPNGKVYLIRNVTSMYVVILILSVRLNILLIPSRTQSQVALAVGTELNLVSRIANEFKPHDKVVRFMSPLICNCSTMNRILLIIFIIF